MTTIQTDTAAASSIRDHTIALQSGTIRGTKTAPRCDNSRGHDTEGVASMPHQPNRLSPTAPYKQCPGCERTLPRSAFNRLLSTTDGLQSRCRECQATAQKAHRLANIDASREAEREAARRRRRANPGRYIEINRAWEARNREKHLAHVAVDNAVRAGRLVKPEGCGECGKSGRIEAHHDSYEREHRLDVRWLCPACHRAEHLPHQKEAA